MKKEKVNNRKYVLSRKILFLSIIIIVPLLVLIIWFISGFVNSRVGNDIKTKFEIENANEVNYQQATSFNDFNLKFYLTDYTKASESSNGSLTGEYQVYYNSDVKVTNLKMSFTAADYWSHYVATPKSKSSVTISTSVPSSNSTLGTLTLDYKSKNGWGIDATTSTTPDIYLYLSYTYVDKDGKKSDKMTILTYKFNDFSSSIRFKE